MQIHLLVLVSLNSLVLARDDTMSESCGMPNQGDA